MSSGRDPIYQAISAHVAIGRTFTRAGAAALSAAIERQARRHGGELFAILPPEDGFGGEFLGHLASAHRLRHTIIFIDGEAAAAVVPRPGLQVLRNRLTGRGAWSVVWLSPAGGAAFSLVRSTPARRSRFVEYRGFVTYEPAAVLTLRKTARALAIASGGADPGAPPSQPPQASLEEVIEQDFLWEVQGAAALAEERARALEVRKLELAEANAEMVERLVNIMLHRDAETGTHLRRIGWYAQDLAEQLGEDIRYCLDISFASMLHDIGKMVIPDHVLMDPGELDDTGWDVMRQHPELGARLLAGSSSPLLNMAERIALAHHERWDGGGYPHGLVGEAIPLEAQVTSVVDAFDAMTTHRRYRAPMPADEALAELRRHAGTQFGPDVVRAFLQNPPSVAASGGLRRGR